MAIQSDANHFNTDTSSSNYSSNEYQNKKQLPNTEQSKQYSNDSTNSTMVNNRKENQQTGKLYHHPKENKLAGENDNDGIRNATIEQLKAIRNRVQRQSKVFRKNVSEFIISNVFNTTREFSFKKLIKHFIEQVNQYPIKNKININKHKAIKL